MRAVALAAIALAVVACSCSPDLPVPSERSHRDDVRSDCRSWLVARLSPEQIGAVAAIDPSDVDDLAELQERLGDLGVDASLSSLRFRRIAERRGEDPLPEGVVVEEFVRAAGEIAAGG